MSVYLIFYFFFFFQAEDGIRDRDVTGVQTCALPISIVREFRQVLESGYTDQKGVPRKPLLGKTIVFAVTKRHAETLAQLLDQAFADKKPSPEIRYADYVVSGMGGDDTVDGMTKIRRFKREQFPQILVSVNMLDTGFDCPEIVNLVFARFT